MDDKELELIINKFGNDFPRAYDIHRNIIGSEYAGIIITLNHPELLHKQLVSIAGNILGNAVMKDIDKDINITTLLTISKEGKPESMKVCSCRVPSFGYAFLKHPDGRYTPDGRTILTYYHDIQLDAPLDTKEILDQFNERLKTYREEGKEHLTDKSKYNKISSTERLTISKR